MQVEELLSQAREHYKNSQVKKLEKAIKVAIKAHSGQKRLSGEDFITHPLEVASILIDWKLDIETIMAGVLHDTIEDTQLSVKDIKKSFGKEVAFLVDGVTKVSQARSGMRNISSYLPQTKSNLSKLLIAVCSDLRIILIKLADRLHNMRTLEHLSKEKQLKIAQETIDVFAPLADRLGMGRLRVELEELAFSYLEPERYEELRLIMKKRLGKSHKHLEKVRRDVNKHLQAEGIKFTLDGRVKSVYSLHKKLAKVNEDIDEVYDLLAQRIILDSKSDCYKTLGILHSIYQPMLAKIKDYISVPKPNGYQSLHTTVLTPYEQIVEFQIRTEPMHAFAERGLAAGFHYNEQKLTKNYRRTKVTGLPRNLGWISELQDRVQNYLDSEGAEHADLSLDLFSDRIFVYSPNGDIYDLPDGSVALDFAYGVHSEVGEHAQGARINQKMRKLSTPLENGDIIDIIKSKNVHPTKDWLEIVKTERAKQRIRQYFKRIEDNS